MGLIIHAPYYDQTRRWPNGCEAVSTVMLLQYLGIRISVDEFMHRDMNFGPRLAWADTCEDKEKVGQIASGEEMLRRISTPDHCVLEGSDPWLAYVGDPWGDRGCWGCYAPVIIRAMERLFRRVEETDGNAPEDRTTTGRITGRMHAVDLTGVPMEKLLSDYLDKNMPVIFWATLDMKPYEEGPCWFVRGGHSDEACEEGSAANKADTAFENKVKESKPLVSAENAERESGRRVFTWRSNEHCLLLVGYDDQKYYFNDPWHNHGCIGYERSLVEKRHAEQYSMAVSVKI